MAPAEAATTDATFSIEWMGERALLVHVAAAPGPAATRRAAAVAQALTDKAPAGLQEVVPAYTSVLALLDPFALANDVDPSRVRRAVARIARGALDALGPGGEGFEGRLWEVPVRYGGEYGPDLAAVAAWAGLTPAEVARIHSEGVYDVMAVGFRPGYPYLGFLDERIAAPRLDTPRPRVEIGSVGIGSRQTGIYTRTSSGGWQIVGRTDFVLFDASAATPAEACRLHVGDRVRFVALEVVA